MLWSRGKSNAFAMQAETSEPAHRAGRPMTRSSSLGRGGGAFLWLLPADERYPDGDSGSRRHPWRLVDLLHRDRTFLTAAALAGRALPPSAFHQIWTGMGAFGPRSFHS